MGVCGLTKYARFYLLKCLVMEQLKDSGTTFVKVCKNEFLFSLLWRRDKVIDV